MNDLDSLAAQHLARLSEQDRKRAERTVAEAIGACWPKRWTDDADPPRLVAELIARGWTPPMTGG